MKNKGCGKLRKFVGFFWCLLHIFFLATASTLVKYIDSVPAEEKLFIRCITQFIFLLPSITYISHKENFKVFGTTKLFIFLFCRGLFGSVGALFLYQALDIISLGDAVSVTFCSSIFAGIFSHIFLKEPYTKFDICFTVVSLSGVVLIAKPAFIFGYNATNYGWKEVGGVGLALLNAILVGASLTLIRRMSKTNPILSVFYYTWIGIIISAIGLFSFGYQMMPCKTDLLLCFCIGLLGMFSQLSVTKALQTEKSTTIAIFRSFQLVLVFIYQVN